MEGQLLNRKQLALAVMVLVKRAGGTVTIPIEELEGLQHQMMQVQTAPDGVEVTLTLISKTDAAVHAADTGEPMEIIKDEP